MKPYIKYFLISFSIILLDQSVKILVKFNLDYNEEIPLIGNLFKIHFIENPGAAFGVTVSNLVSVFGKELNDVTGKLILSVFSILAVSAIGYILYRVSFFKTKLPLFVAMIFGGAIGNIIDRVFYGVWFASRNNYDGSLFHGRVVDMFYLDFWEGFIPQNIPFLGGTYMSLWPIFNIADAAISIGIVSILIFQNKLLAPEHLGAAQENPEHNPAVIGNIPASEAAE
ncbi:MAG: signal peptidase II [Bacteroidia bacterium]|nr:signal peptidase II [Bacteroidia bacterium]